MIKLLKYSNMCFVTVKKYFRSSTEYNNYTINNLINHMNS